MTKKTRIPATALFIILASVILTAALPIANAQTVTTRASLSVTPNPVGINQQVSIAIWVQPIAPTSGEVLHEFKVTITKPDATTETLGPVDSWPHGAAFFTYTPKQLGTYKFKFSYPGETYESTGEEYLPADSPVTELIVQQEPIPDLPQTTLPTEYWTNPVSSENQYWNIISGSWLMCYYDSTYTGFADSTGGFNPYSTAPRSPHIMWTKALANAGLAGGEMGSWGEYSGASYDSRLTPPIVMDGKLYYNLESSKWGHFRRELLGGFVCVDLRTGQELWRSTTGGVDVGQHWKRADPGYQGLFSYLWDTMGSEWDVYSPFDGRLLFSFENATQGTDWWWEDPVVFGDGGEMHVYILDGYANYLAMWNSTKAFLENGVPIRYDAKPGLTYDWRKGIEWNTTIPNRQVDWHAPYSIFGVSDDVAIAKSGTGGGVVDFDIAYDINTGKEIWVHDKANSVQTFFSTTGEGVFVSFDMTERRWIGYDIETGSKLWESDQNEYPWGTYVGYGQAIAYGKLYSTSADGYLHALDIKNGKQVWKLYSGDSGTETVFGHYQFWYGPIIADGVVFAGTGEETPTQPLTRGNRVFAADAETGQQLWNISGYMSLRAIADGYLLGYNAYDSQAYCFGKGPSKTTVTAPEIGVPYGYSLVIRGTVTDESPGSKAKGTAAISDEYMSQWMEYIFMQKPRPEKATGVQVTIEVTDSNNNTRPIGNVTSDSTGMFTYSWKPDIPGAFKVAAKFAGSESYYPSSDETSFVVDPETKTPAQPETEPSMTDTYILYSTAAIITAIAVGFAVAILLLRKKP